MKNLSNELLEVKKKLDDAAVLLLEVGETLQDLSVMAQNIQAPVKHRGGRMQKQAHFRECYQGLPLHEAVRQAVNTKPDRPLHTSEIANLIIKPSAMNNPELFAEHILMIGRACWKASHKRLVLKASKGYYQSLHRPLAMPGPSPAAFFNRPPES